MGTKLKQIDFPHTTTGDLMVYNSSGDLVRFAAGTNDYVLVPDSGEALGLKWVISTAVAVEDATNIIAVEVFS